MGKPVPPAPGPDAAAARAPRVPRLSVLDQHEVMADGWQPIEQEEYGGWRLRAAEGFTGRSNSVLPLGPPPVALPDGDRPGRAVVRRAPAAGPVLPAVGPRVRARTSPATAPTRWRPSWSHAATSWTPRPFVMTSPAPTADRADPAENRPSGLTRRPARRAGPGVAGALPLPRAGPAARRRPGADVGPRAGLRLAAYADRRGGRHRPGRERARLDRHRRRRGGARSIAGAGWPRS